MFVVRYVPTIVALRLDRFISRLSPGLDTFCMGTGPMCLYQTMILCALSWSAFYSFAESHETPKSYVLVIITLKSEVYHTTIAV